MASLDKLARISVRTTNDTLVISRVDGETYSILCSVKMHEGVSYFLEGETKVVVIDNAYKAFGTRVLNLNSAVEAQQLITQLSDAQIRHESRMRSRKQLRKGVWLAAAVSAVVLGGWYWSVVVATSHALPVAAASIAKPATVVSATPAFVQQAQKQSMIPQDDWAVPVEARKMLAENLGKAAARLTLTVNYSSGHARSLFVFADPNCPNCQNLEPALREASKSFNVIVFPVAVIGGEKSAELIRPILCLAPDKRAAAWDALFDVGRDGLDFGKHDSAPGTTASGDCELGQQILDANHAAWKAYKIPGTPWVISDDGRYVPQALVRNASNLQIFLDNKEAADAAR